MNIRERLQQILIVDYKIAPERATEDARLDDLGIDSLGLMELMFKVEDEYDIRLPLEQVELNTMGEVAVYVEKLVAKQSAVKLQKAHAR
ncbi:MAG: phosphopantetheine-binding protein [Paucimonas sp.]|jgi:acyl carrier protein|nr:phosphopantetheine-binding protein [Paucimonas sp.]